MNQLLLSMTPEETKTSVPLLTPNVAEHNIQ